MNKKLKKGKGTKSYIFTRETLGVTLCLFSALVFLMLMTGKMVFAGIGYGVCMFMYGTFGYGSYLILLSVIYLGIWLTFERSIKIAKKPLAFMVLAIVCLFLLFHSVSTRNFELNSFHDYITACYMNTEKGFIGYTAGGVICGLLVYPIAKSLSFIGCYIVFSILFVLAAYLLLLSVKQLISANETKQVKVGQNAEKVPCDSTTDPLQDRKVDVEDSRYHVNNQFEIIDNRVEETAPANVTVDEDPFSARNLGRKILFEKDEFAAESYRRNMIYNENSYFNHPVQNDGDYIKSFSDKKKPVSTNENATVPENGYVQSYQEQVANNQETQAPSNYFYGAKPVQNLEDNISTVTFAHNVEEVTWQEDNTGEKEYVNEETDLQVDDVWGDEEEEIIVEEENEEVIEPSTEENISVEEQVQEEFVQQDQVEQAPPQEDLFIRRRGEDIIPVEQTKASDYTSNSLYNIFNASNTRISGTIEPDVSRLNLRSERSRINLFDDQQQEELPKRGEFSVGSFGITEAKNAEEDTAINANESEIEITEGQPSQPVIHIAPPTQKPNDEVLVVEEKPKHVWKEYVRPPMELLGDYPENDNVNTGEIESIKRGIVDTLAHFKISSEISDVVVAPALTRYDVRILDSMNIKKSLNYKEQIAMALKKESVNAYLNYAKGAVSFEIPNSNRAIVGLKSMLASSKFINSKPNSLTFALGKNLDSEVVCPDITKMPHLLVAGTSGSGKSVCLSSLIISLLYKYGPEELRFILVDPKQVEFIPYDKLPHLMINEIIYDVDKAIKALNWAIKEMERRYTLFKEMTEQGKATKDLVEYNNNLPEGEEKLAKVVIILDEFGDLMLQAKRDIESRIIKLVQKARAAGIHLILATQRPSVDCITGLIKSNLSTRIGFKVGSMGDSMTIFDAGGAEKLLGLGDMYFRANDKPELTRIQGCFINSKEIQRVTDFIKEHNETYFDKSVSEFINAVDSEDAPSSAGDGMMEAETKIDDTYIKALYFCVTANQASVSMIQRRFPVGYMKACKIIDWMANMNYIGASEGSKPRKMLLTREEFISKYGEIDD